MLFAVPKGVRNLAGLVFGELTPQSIVRVTPAEGAVWNCTCTCGGTREVAAKNLTGERVRVTRCTECARLRRTAQLHASYQESRSRRGDSNSSYQRDWAAHLDQMDDEQRAIYDDYIARRRKLNIVITDSIRAGAVEAAMFTTRMRAA